MLIHPTFIKTFFSFLLHTCEREIPLTKLVDKKSWIQTKIMQAIGNKFIFQYMHKDYLGLLRNTYCKVFSQIFLYLSQLWWYNYLVTTFLQSRDIFNTCRSIFHTKKWKYILKIELCKFLLFRFKNKIYFIIGYYCLRKRWTKWKRILIFISIILHSPIVLQPNFILLLQFHFLRLLLLFYLTLNTS